MSCWTSPTTTLQSHFERPHNCGFVRGLPPKQKMSPLEAVTRYEFARDVLRIVVQAEEGLPYQGPVHCPSEAGIGGRKGAARRQKDRFGLQENVQGSRRQERGGGQVLGRQRAPSAQSFCALRASHLGPARLPRGLRSQAALERKRRRARDPERGARGAPGGRCPKNAQRKIAVFPQLSSRAPVVGRHAADWQSGFGHALDQGMTSLGSSSPLRKFIHLGYEDIHGRTGENMPGRDFFVVISHGE